MEQFKIRSEAQEWYEDLSDQDFVFLANINYQIYTNNFGSDDTLKNLQDKFERLKKAELEKNETEKRETKFRYEKRIQVLTEKTEDLQTELDNSYKITRGQINAAVEAERKKAEKDLNREVGKRDRELELKQEEIRRLTLNKDEIVGKEMSLLRGELDLKHNTEINSLKNRLDTALVQNQEKDVMIGMLQSDKDKIFEEIMTCVRRKEKPSLIGKDGEAYVQQLLRDLFIRTKNVSSVNNKGDFSIKFPNSSVCAMIDVKNYCDDRSIPKKERQKFIDDLDNNSEYHCGILLSLNGGFTNKLVELKVYETDKGKPYCFLGKLATHPIPDVVLKSCLLSLLFTTEKTTTRNMSHNGLIKIIQDSIKFLCEGVENAEAWIKEADKLHSKAKKNKEELKRKAEEIKSNFEMIQLEGPNNDVEINGDDPEENASPAKVPRTG